MRLRTCWCAKPVSSSAAPAAPDPSKTLTGLMCLFHAHLANASSPGCFQKTLSDSLAENGLPDVKLPPPPPSQGLEAMLRAFSVGAPHAASQTPAATPTETDSTVEDDAASVSSSAPSSSSSDETETDEPEETPSGNNVVHFGFVMKENPRKKTPTTRREFDHYIRQGNLILCHTGPPEMEQVIRDHARQNLCSLHKWLVVSNDDYERASNDPRQIIGDALHGRLPPECK